jgi:GNAT superfamily N-acetyltransferase
MAAAGLASIGATGGSRGSSIGASCHAGLRAKMRAMALAFRRATDADADAAAGLWLRAREAAAGTMPPPAHPDAEVRAWFTSHVVPRTECWLAEDAEGRVAGLLVLDGRWLDQLYVEPEMTGRGIGSELVALAKRLRPDGLRLWTFASNLGAQRFYERHGFVAVLRTDGRDNEERAPDILFCWGDWPDGSGQPSVPV